MDRQAHAHWKGYLEEATGRVNQSDRVDRSLRNPTIPKINPTFSMTQTS